MDPTFGLPRAAERPLGIHAGVWGFAWGRDDARRTVAGAAAAGFDFVEIPASPTAISDPDATRAALSSTGLGATVSLALDPSTEIHTEDAAVAAEGERRLGAAVDFAAEIGAPFVGGVIHSAMTRYRTVPTTAARDSVIEVLSRVADRAAAAGVTLGVEYVNRYESNLLNTAAQTAHLLADIGRPNVVLHLDTFHAHVEEPSVPRAIADAGPLLGYVHLSESHRGELGTGALDWRAVMDALAVMDYRGPLTVETFSPAVIAPADAIEIGLWRTLWRDPDALARTSFAFLRGLRPALETSPSTPTTPRKEQS